MFKNAATEKISSPAFFAMALERSVKFSAQPFGLALLIYSRH
jgi:hypothetical protein